jgi:hypothetical protein
MVRRYAIAANAVHTTNTRACVLESKKEIPSMQTAMTKPQPMTAAGATLSSFTTRAAPAGGRATRPSAGRDEEINEAHGPNAPDPQPRPRHNPFR